MPIDERNELLKARAIFFFGAMVLVSCFMVWSEIAYLISGETATATVTKSFSSTSRRGGAESNIEFAFTEKDGRARKDIVIMGGSTPLPAEGEKIAIQYTPGELGRSRLAGRVNWFWIAVFAASVLGVAVFGYIMYRDSRDVKRK